MKSEVDLFLAQLDAKEIDALILPVHPVPATKPAYFPYGIPVGYTGIFNLLGFASGSIPLGKVTAED